MFPTLKASEFAEVSREELNTMATVMERGL